MSNSSEIFVKIETRLKCLEVKDETGDDATAEVVV